MILLICSMTTFVLFGIVFLFIYGICTIKTMSKKLKEEKIYNESLQTLHDDLHAFRHDFANILQAIGGYIDSGDIKGLRVYYSELCCDFQISNNCAFLSRDIVNSPAIYSLFLSKYGMANKLGITMLFNFSLNFQTLPMKIYQFSRILGIFLDNAIEAASECSEKIIRVELRKDPFRKCQILVIENTYISKNIDVEHMFEKGISSKEHNTGLGLWEVNKILKKYPNVKLDTSYDGHFFTQNLEMYEEVFAQKEVTVL